LYKARQRAPIGFLKISALVRQPRARPRPLCYTQMRDITTKLGFIDRTQINTDHTDLYQRLTASSV
jgi:hypothetical protein